MRMDARNALSRIHEKEIDLIFMDPPYEAETVHDLLRLLPGQPYVTQDTLMIVETSLTTDFSYLEETGLSLVREKVYRSNRHLFIRKA